MIGAEVSHILGFITAAGVGGIWFRLGSLFSRIEGQEKRVNRIDARLSKLEANP